IGAVEATGNAVRAPQRRRPADARPTTTVR
ncbi:MAG: hypothetical protein QOJ21_3483, partial [Solirubrobacteraceae bacterium]|nr:hypothetical protein [Solirubrobacteraceae bacterium]